MDNDDTSEGTIQTNPDTVGKAEGNARKELLLKMYDQMFNDINTHIIVVWQSIGVLVGAFAVLALVERNIISVDIGTSLILLLCGWLWANLLDSSYWYNRNLAIIANIERQFLLTSDLRDIHYYFGAHRPNNKMITHLRIQRALGVGIGLLVLLFHFSTRVLRGLSEPWSNFEFQRSLPYIIVTAVLAYVVHIKKHRNHSYAEFIQRSPGKLIDTSGIVYGEGHGFAPSSRRPETEKHS